MRYISYTTTTHNIDVYLLFFEKFTSPVIPHLALFTTIMDVLIEVHSRLDSQRRTLLHNIQSGVSVADLPNVIRNLTHLRRWDLFAKSVVLGATVTVDDFEFLWDWSSNDAAAALRSLVEACSIGKGDVGDVADTSRALDASAVLQKARVMFSSAWLPKHLSGSTHSEDDIHERAVVMGVPFLWNAIPCMGGCGSSIWKLSCAADGEPEQDEQCPACSTGVMNVTIRCGFKAPFTLCVKRSDTVLALALHLLQDGRCTATLGCPTLDVVTRWCALGTNGAVVGPCGLDHEDNWCRDDVTKTLGDKGFLRSGSTLFWRFNFLMSK